MLKVLAAARARMRRVHNDDGISLTELVVGMTLASLVGAIGLTIFLGANASLGATTTENTSSASAQVVLQTWNGLLQSADAPQTTNTCATGATAHRFEWVTGRETLFYTNLANRAGDGTCRATQMAWLGLRNGVLVEARYTATSATMWALNVCRALTSAQTVTASSSNLFTPNPGQVNFAANFGAGFAAGSPFSTVTSCANMPSTVPVSAVSDTDTAANNALSTVRSVGIDFTLSDPNGAHARSYDSVVAVLSGTSSS